MRYLLFLLAVLGSAPTLAQTSPNPDSIATASPAASLVSTTAPAAPDTVAAIHSLFAAERRTAYIGGAFFSLLGVSVSAFKPSHNANTGTLLVIPAIFIGTGMVASGLRYNRRYEQRVVEAYKVHGSLPPFIRKRLRPWHFRHPASTSPS